MVSFIDSSPIRMGKKQGRIPMYLTGPGAQNHSEATLSAAEESKWRARSALSRSIMIFLMAVSVCLAM
jgi:hypothetical protein